MAKDTNAGATTIPQSRFGPENLEVNVVEDVLILKVDLRAVAVDAIGQPIVTLPKLQKDGTLKGGGNYRLASSRGNQPIGEHGTKFSVNMYRPAPTALVAERLAAAVAD